MSPNPKLQLFRQKCDQEFDMVSSSCDVRQTDNAIIYLDTISGCTERNGANNIELVAVHEDGAISCYTEALEKEIWTMKAGASGDSANKTRVVYARVMPVEEAQRALLKGREDLLASLSGSKSLDSIRLLVLMTLSDKDHSLTLRISRIDVSTADLSSSSGRMQKQLQEVSSVPVPTSNEPIEEPPQIRLHVASGTLYRIVPGSITTYDISGCVTKMGYKLNLEHGTASSSLRISSSLVSISNENTISILDVRYNACQAQLQSSKHRKPRKIIDAEKDDNVRDASSRDLVLLSYNASLDVVIALQDRELKGFQLATLATPNNFSYKRKRGGLLIDSIGRGTVSTKRTKLHNEPSPGLQSVGVSPQSKHDAALWKKQKSLLNKCFANGDVVGLERLIDSNSEAEIPIDNDQSRAENVFTSDLDRRKLEYVIGKIVETESQRSAGTHEIFRRLRISKSATRIPQCLFKQGRFTDFHVETALKHRGLISSSDVIRTGSVAEALARWDPSLQTSLAFLDGSAPFTAAEIVHVLRHSIIKDEKLSSSTGKKLLTDVEAQDNADVDTESTRQMVLADDGISPARQNGSDDITTARILQTATAKLNAFPSREASNALRSILSRAELRFLVDMLRIQLARHGWLTPYIEEGFHSTVQAHAEDNQICAVANLLSCAVDSIGTAGWIMDRSVTDDLTDTAETIAYMKAEISAALEGIEEATYLKGMLGEMLLCSKSARHKHLSIPKQDNSNEPCERPGSGIVSIGDDTDLTLPLGLKLPQGTSEYKVGAGGELIKRSLRDIGRLKSRMVPKYSFERIIV